MTTRCAPGEEILGTGYELITSGPPLVLSHDREYDDQGQASWLVSLQSNDGSSILVADFYTMCWSLSVFENGFESGDTMAWSAAGP